MIIDSHVHLDTKRFNKDIDEVIQRAKDKGVNKFIIPAIESDNMDGIIKLCEKYDEIYFSSGNHPNRLDSFDMKNIEKYISHEKCVAVGECGLDWFRIPKGSNLNDIKKRQIEVFEEQILLSSKYNKPLILHSRDTDKEMMETLMKHKNILVGGVVHCYLGSENLLKLKDYNFYFGIGGIVTYKSATELRDNLIKVPLDRIIIETDAPYLTPGSNRKLRNEPSFTPIIVKEVSILLNMSVEMTEKVTYENTERLFFN